MKIHSYQLWTFSTLLRHTEADVNKYSYKIGVFKGAPKPRFMHYPRVAFSAYFFGKLVFRLPVFLSFLSTLSF